MKLKVLVCDANVLIDYFTHNKTILEKCTGCFCEVYVVRQVLEEVLSLPSSEVSAIGIKIYTPSSDQVAEASESRGSLSFEDWLCLIAARDEGWTCLLGSDDYLCLLEFQQRHGLPLGVAAALVGGNGAGSHGKVRSVKKGTFKIGDMTHAHQVTDITDLCRRCGIAFATNAPFVVALSRAVRVPEFDTEIFKSRVKTYPSLMGRRSSADDYLVEIEKLYNFKTRDKRMPLVIRAHEIGLERQRTFARQGGRHKS